MGISSAVHLTPAPGARGLAWKLKAVKTRSKRYPAGVVNRMLLCWSGEVRSMIRDFLFLFLFFILLAVWLVGWAAFHVAGGLIHLLLIFAVISLVIHLFSGRRAA